MQKLNQSLNKSLNESLNERLQSKYPHLELAVLPLSEVNKDNESKRIDSEYFKKEYLENEKLLLKLNSVKLSNFCSFICNGDDCRDYDENGLKYIRTGDIKEYGLDLYNCATIRNNFISNTKLEIGDLLITRKGNYGKSQVVNNEEILESIISSEIFQLKLKGINPYFVDIFLKSKFGQIQFEKNIHGVSNFSVTQEALLNFLIPQFSQDFQLEIEKLIKDSHKALEDSKTLYKEAENLLYESLGLDSKNPLESLHRSQSSLRGSVSNEAIHKSKMDCHDSTLRAESRNDDKDSLSLACGSLSCSPSLAEGARGWVEKYPHLNISIRALSQSYGKSGRLDSEYYQSKYDFMENKIKSKGFKTLQEICSLINYGSVPTSPYTENGDGVPYIKGLNLKNLEINEDKLDKIKNVENLDSKFFTKENDIIISQMGTVGDCGVVNKAQENYIFASFTIRVRLKNTQEFNPYFVALYIQNIAKEWYLLRNIAQASVRQNTDLPTIRNLYVPKIDSTTQEQIASKIQKSFALRKVAKDLLESAKSKVENKIEGKQ